MTNEIATLLRRVASELDRPTSQYLLLPSEEAKACWARMFLNLGKHPLLGLGALGGLLGLIAYAKALLELGRMGLADDGLIGTSDVSGFTARLGVPFILLVLMYAGFSRALVELLTRDHRNPRRFAAFVLLGCVLIVLPFGLLFLWSDPLSVGSLAAPSAFAALCCIAVLGFGLALLRAGQITEIATDDSVQRAVLSLLRFGASVQGLLLVFVVLGFGLLFATNGVSALFWREAPEISHLSSGRPTGEDQLWPLDSDRGAWNSKRRIVEMKWEIPISTGPSVTRLGGRWIVFPENEPAPGALPWRDSNPSAWVALSAEDVACIRPRGRENEPRLLCRKPPTDPVEPGKPIGQASIGGIASQVLGCEPQALRDTTDVLLTQFLRDLPRSENDLAIVGAWMIPGSDLFEPGIPIVKDSQRASDEQIQGFVRTYEVGEMWVLGLSSAPGTPTYNLDLSERRALVTRKRLAQHLSSPALSANLKTLGMGEHPVADLTGVQGAKEHQVSVAFACKRP